MHDFDVQLLIVQLSKGNPDQSKHLETARMRICDTWIDFVNLRSETYAENSRIPTMKFGTAEEDAYRRDLTINSLFYNINTNSVEDVTGRGIQDLKSGRIVTPLSPKATFLDDPLRVLRAIRFGARFDFELAEELKEAAFDEEVKTALANKISRERIGHEVDLMMSDKQPAKAMAYIHDLKLFYAVFTFPENLQPAVLEQCDRYCVLHINAAWTLLQSIGYSIFSDEQRRLYLYASLFLPVRSTICIDKKSKEVPVASYIIRDSLKLKASDAEMVTNLHVACEKFVDLIPFLESNEDPEDLKVNLEDEYLEIPPASTKRVLAVLCALLLAILSDMSVTIHFSCYGYSRLDSNTHNVEDGLNRFAASSNKRLLAVALLISTLLHPKASHTCDSLNSHTELDRRREIFGKFESAITQLDLDHVWKMKLLLDGKAMMGVLQLKSGGPSIGKWQQRLLKWQLAHPNGTMEECIDWIKQSQAKCQKIDCSA
uniref:Poly A polymerase head domain-containing protein n=1 Tax=Ananas comosus var. bracteatus TaxID=296719 RepID=A0A6V7Q2B2_ANACO|nr:unnamed protein product [Ananas comosus var. bracteatus]